jgi:glycosyltransferase involved in cell wall biosynthesis
MDDVQMKKASACQPRPRNEVLRLLFVGRLSKPKNVDVLLRAAAILMHEGLALEVTIVGDGPELESLRSLASAEGVQPHVSFTGPVPQEMVFDHYQKSHVLVLASETEGWPKALSEGMAFANVCIGSNRGLVPQMLAGGRGLTVEPGSVRDLVAAIRTVYENPREALRMAEAGADWSRRFTLDEFARELRNVLASRLGIDVPQAKELCTKGA